MNLFHKFLRIFGVEVHFLGETRLENAEAKSTPPPVAPLTAVPPPTSLPNVALPTTATSQPGGTIAIPAQTAPFVTEDILQKLPLLTPRDIDRLDFGCVKVSDQGLVQMYNKWESEFAGVPQETALGRNFFRELAPCTNNRLIFGRFKDGVTQGELNTLVSYAFTYKMRPTLVRVHLYRDPATKTNWVLVQKHEARPGK
jgi:photoactive yellow protein